MQFGIIGEDSSDVNTLKVLVKKLAGNDSLTINTKGYHGCGQMLRKGAQQFKLFVDLGCTHLIVCYDADGPDAEVHRAELMEKIVEPSGVPERCCAVVPVQELEAWIIADIAAVTKIFASWRPKSVSQNPESISSPKEFLERLSKAENGKPRYSHATHNERIAAHLDLQMVHSRCESFRPLKSFVNDAVANEKLESARALLTTDPEQSRRMLEEIVTAYGESAAASPARVLITTAFLSMDDTETN